MYHFRRFFQSRWVYLFPGLIGVLVYAHTANHAFVYDDGFFTDVPEYRSIASLPLAFTKSYNADHPQSGLYRPIPTVSFILTYSLFGESPIAFHIGNILIHGMVCSLIFILLFYFLKFELPVCIGVSLLFAVLPIHTEAVANIKSRDELLFTLFFLLSWIGFVAGKKRRIWYAASSFFWLLSLLSKELSIVSPGIIFLWASIENPRLWKQQLLSLLWFIPAFGIYVALRQNAQLPGLHSQFEFAYGYNPLIYVSGIPRLLSFFKILFIYIEKTVFPFSLSASYHINHFKPVVSFLDVWGWLPGLGMLIGIFMLVFFTLKRNKRMGLGGIVFLVSYLPISQLVLPGGDVVAERWMYLPTIGVCIVIIYSIYILFRSNKKYYYILLSIMIVLYGIRTGLRNSVWASDRTLFLSMTKDAPKSYRGHFLLAKQYLKPPLNLPKAKESLAKAIGEAETPEIYNAFAFIALLEGKMDDSQLFLQKSSALDPRLVATDSLWAKLLYQRHDYTQAFFYSQKIITSKLYKTDDLFSHVLILTKLKRYEEAHGWLSELLQRDTKNWEPRFLQAVIWYKTGKKIEALDVTWNSTLTEQERLVELEQF